MEMDENNPRPWNMDTDKLLARETCWPYTTLIAVPRYDSSPTTDPC